MQSTSTTSTTLTNSNNHTLERLRKNDPSLTKLKLVHPPESYYAAVSCEDDGACENTDNNSSDDKNDMPFNDLLQCLRENTTVTYVLLERQFVRELSRADFASVLQAIGTMASLQELEIWSVRVPLTELCQAMAQAKRLTRLGFGFVSFLGTPNNNHQHDCNTLDASALRHHPSLQNVYVSDFRLSPPLETSEDETHRPTTDTAATAVTNLDSFVEALSTCPKLNFVEMFQYQQEDQPAMTSQGLARLVDSKSLTQLTLRRMKLTDELTNDLSERLTIYNNIYDNKTKLKCLNLAENQLGDDGVTALTSALVGKHSLRELDVRKNDVTARGCVAACRALQANIGLEKLTLACNSIGDEGASKGLAPLLRVHPTLQTLELHRTDLTDAGCGPLVETLRGGSASTKTSRLLHLDVSFNDITEATYLCAADALRDNHTLQSINLQVNRKLKRSVVACQALVGMLRVNTTLQQISTLLRVRYEPQDYHKVEELLHDIQLYLKLNQGGRRRRLLQGQATLQDWGTSLVSVKDDLNGVYYLMQANPALLSRQFLMNVTGKQLQQTPLLIDTVTATATVLLSPLSAPKAAIMAA